MSSTNLPDDSQWKKDLTEFTILSIIITGGITLQNISLRGEMDLIYTDLSKKYRSIINTSDNDDQVKYINITKIILYCSKKIVEKEKPDEEIMEICWDLCEALTWRYLEKEIINIAKTSKIIKEIFGDYEKIDFAINQIIKDKENADLSLIAEGKFDEVKSFISLKNKLKKLLNQ